MFFLFLRSVIEKQILLSIFKKKLRQFVVGMNDIRHLLDKKFVCINYRDLFILTLYIYLLHITYYAETDYLSFFVLRTSRKILD